MRLRRAGAVIGVLLLIAALGGALWTVWVFLPSQAVQDGRFDKSKVSADEATIEEKRLKARNDARSVGAQLLAALAVIVGGAATWRTVRLTRQGQVTDRYSVAVEHLAEKDKIGMQLGGIYALERIARDSPRDHWPIMGLLVDYIHRSARPAPNTSDTPSTQPSPGVRAVAAALARRKATRERRNQVLELGGLDLRNINLRRADLRGANFSRSDLSGAYLERCRLNGAQLQDTRLRGAQLRQADLKNAVLRDADLEGARLEGANFAGAELDLAQFKGASIDSKTKGLPAWAVRQADQPRP